MADHVCADVVFTGASIWSLVKGIGELRKLEGKVVGFQVIGVGKRGKYGVGVVPLEVSREMCCARDS